MRRLVLAVGAACAAVGIGVAQQGLMPGQTVGTGYTLNRVGNQVSKAAPPAADMISNPLMRPYDPTKPLDAFKGTGIDPKTVMAPIGSGGYPGVPTNNPNLLERVWTKVYSATDFFRPTPVTRPSYTPGIARRNRERAEARMWMRD